MISRLLSYTTFSLLLLSKTLSAEPGTSSIAASADFVEREELKDGLYSLNHLYKSNYTLKKWKKKIFGWTPDGQLQKQLHRLDHHQTPLSFDDVKSYYLDYYLPLADLHLSVIFNDEKLHLLPVSFSVVDHKIVVNKSSVEKILPGDELIAVDGISPLLYARKQYWIPSNEYQVTNSSTPRFQKWRALSRHRELEFFCNRISVVKGLIFPGPSSDSLELTFQRTGSTGNKELFTERTDWQRSNLQEYWSKNLKQSEAEDSKPFSLKFLKEKEKTIALFQIKTFAFDLSIDQPILFELFHSIKKARTESDAIIIDLRNNGGGNAITCAFIASCFINEPHIFMRDVQNPSCRNYLVAYMRNQLSEESVAKIRKLVMSSDDLGENLPVYQAFLNLYQNTASWEKSFIDQYGKQEKKKLIKTICQVSPSIPDAPSPKIFVLQNFRSVSASEIFSAFMQSSGTAKVAGTLSAGATSIVQGFSIGAHKGVLGGSITVGFTLIDEKGKERIIEDIGVVPDIEIALERQDLFPKEGSKKEDPILSKLVHHITSEGDDSSPRN